MLISINQTGASETDLELAKIDSDLVPSSHKNAQDD